MGRYSTPLAAAFADFAGVAAGQTAIDVGCGPGALTAELVGRLGADAVCAVDPSPPFAAACEQRNPGVDVQVGRSEAIPFDADRFDVTLSQLVLHFVSEPDQAAAEMRRVTRSGGTVAACVWDFANEMRMLRLYWDAATVIDPDAPDEARTLRFGQPGEIPELLEASRLVDIVEEALTVESTYQDFNELWDGFLLGIGPAGQHARSLPADRQHLLREELYGRLGEPTGRFTLSATARAATGRVP